VQDLLRLDALRAIDKGDRGAVSDDRQAPLLLKNLLEEPEVRGAVTILPVMLPGAFPRQFLAALKKTCCDKWSRVCDSKL